MLRPFRCVSRGVMRVSMIAIGTIDRAGLSAEPGDRLDVTPIQAVMLRYQRLARFSTDEDDIIPEPIPEPEPVKPARKRRAYRRRDMRAED